MDHPTISYWSAGHTTVGASGDTPVPGDYNGDGKADIAVYRPTTASGLFYLQELLYL